MKKPIVILTGSGATIPWGAPNTKQITNIICSDNTFRTKTGQPLGAWLYNKLTHFYHLDPETVNFETILNSVDWLCSFYSSEIRQGLSKFKIQLPVFFKGTDELYDVLDFNRIYQSDKGYWKSDNQRVQFYGMWNDYDYFFEQVYRLFINLIINEVQKYDSSLKGNNNQQLNSLLNTFLNHYVPKNTLRTYTLNYDRFLPQISQVDFFEGFTLDEKTLLKFDANRIFKDLEANCSYSLHGNIYYEQDWPEHVELKQSVVYNFGHSSSDKNDQESRKLINSNIITGLNKSARILENPYSQFYHTFYNDCLNAEIIFTIGYSFSDIHINKAIKEGSLANKNQKIVAVGWDVCDGENTDEFYDRDFFTLSNRNGTKFIDDRHNIYSINLAQNTDRIFYFRKGFEKFLEWQIWNKLA